MANARIARYRKLYACLLRLYPRAYRRRFAEGMEQTFGDLCRERERAGSGLLLFALGTFCETSLGIAKEHFSGGVQLMRSKRILRLALVVACILLIPLVAMQFAEGVTWTTADFVVAGSLLFGTGLAYEFVARGRGNLAYRCAVGLWLASSLFLVWANLAVGLIGSERNPANLMYAAVLGVGIVGSRIARFQAWGMVWTLLAMALVQAAIAGIALLAGMQHDPDSSVAEILGVNGMFVLLWLLSAGLFRSAAQRPGVASLVS